MAEGVYALYHTLFLHRWGKSITIRLYITAGIGHDVRSAVCVPIIVFYCIVWSFTRLECSSVE